MHLKEQEYMKKKRYVSIHEAKREHYSLFLLCCVRSFLALSSKTHVSYVFEAQKCIEFSVNVKKAPVIAKLRCS